MNHTEMRYSKLDHIFASTVFQKLCAKHILDQAANKKIDASKVEPLMAQKCSIIKEVKGSKTASEILSLMGEEKYPIKGCEPQFKAPGQPLDENFHDLYSLYAEAPASPYQDVQIFPNTLKLNLIKEGESKEFSWATVTEANVSSEKCGKVREGNQCLRLKFGYYSLFGGRAKGQELCQNIKTNSTKIAGIIKQ